MNASQTIRCHHHYYRHGKHESRKGVFCGLAIVGIGTLFLLDHIGYLGGFTAWQFWPGLFVLWGLKRFISYRSRVGIVAGLISVAGGGLGLVHTLGIAAVPWNLIWPASIVLVGLSIVTCVLFYKPKKPSQVRTTENGLNAKISMGSHKEICEATDFSGGEITVSMGSYTLDLQGALMSDNEQTLLVKVAMGEVKIQLPSNWRVEVKGSPVMGSIENKTCNSNQNIDDPILKIHADIVLGSLEIKQ